MDIQGSIIDKVIFEQKCKGRNGEVTEFWIFFFFNVELIGFVMDWMQVVKEREESE